MKAKPSYFPELLRSRRSIRQFQPVRLPAELLEQVLDAARYAPSAHNRQPWRFILFTEPAEKRRLAERMAEQLASDRRKDGDPESDIQSDVDRSIARITQAPAVILVSVTLENMDRYPDPGRQRAEHQMGVQSVAMAAQNLLLAAHWHGLGACWLCAPLFSQEVVKQEFEIPASWKPQGLILLGYPAVEGIAKPRKSLGDLVLVASEKGLEPYSKETSVPHE